MICDNGVFIKVQDDLRRLRNVITEKDENGEKIDLSVINSAIADTEQTIRVSIMDSTSVHVLCIIILVCRNMLNT